MKKTLLFVIAVAAAATADAQQALWGEAQIVSPQVNPDRTVTFRFNAPDAGKVEVAGDFGALSELAKNADGIWEYTTPSPLAPELYSYTMFVDGVRMNDPSNVYQLRDVATVSNVFLVPGGSAD